MPIIFAGGGVCGAAGLNADSTPTPVTAAPLMKLLRSISFLVIIIRPSEVVNRAFRPASSKTKFQAELA
jgi:hypothetical protein